MHIENYVGIIDLDGCGFFSFDAKLREVVLGVIKLCGELFPETLGTCFIINAPFAFKAAWSIISPFVDPKTVQKIRICYNVNELKDLIDDDMLPMDYGGTGKLGLHSLSDLSIPEKTWLWDAGEPWSKKNRKGDL